MSSIRPKRRLLSLLSLLLTSAVFAKTKLQRVKNLDYLDADALSYYLDEQTVCPYDVAIMFFAQRDNLSHRIAPVWDEISKIMSAGTAQSNLIMALFDCESDDDHLQLCMQARVTHYPAFVYASLAANHTLTTLGISNKKPRHVVHYPGSNWQHGSAVLDWIRAMKGLSSWHRSGWRKRLRRLFFPFFMKGNPSAEAGAKPLPLGAPKEAVATKQLEELKVKSQEDRALAARTSNFVETLLFPLSDPDATVVYDDGKNYTDVFGWITEEKGWDSTSVSDIVLRSCAIEVAADYCDRCTTVYMEDWIASLPDTTSSLSDETIQSFQTNLTNHLSATEPFCATIDDCIATNFSSSACRPEKCPFNDTAACRYVTSCLRKSLLEEYAEALDLTDTSRTSATSTDSSTSSQQTTSKKTSSTASSTSAKDDMSSTKKKQFSWGM